MPVSVCQEISTLACGLLSASRAFFWRTMPGTFAVHAQEAGPAAVGVAAPKRLAALRFYIFGLLYGRGQTWRLLVLQEQLQWDVRNVRLACLLVQDVGHDLLSELSEPLGGPAACVQLCGGFFHRRLP